MGTKAGDSGAGPQSEAQVQYLRKEKREKEKRPETCGDMWMR